jgi:hypothetical protein
MLYQEEYFGDVGTAKQEPELVIALLKGETEVGLIASPNFP